jgi:hypothetical protein
VAVIEAQCAPVAAKGIDMHLLRLACVCATTVLLALPALAQPDKAHGKGAGGGPPGAQGTNSSSGGSHSGSSTGSSTGSHYAVSDRDRDAIYGYYRQEYAAGRCPPGLARKNNGCLPPGQANKIWLVGQPLPRNVYYEPLPPVLIGRLSPAPAGYQYVRVASDILMLAVGTQLVIASIADLGRL